MAAGAPYVLIAKRANQEPFLAKSRKEEHSEHSFRSESVKENEERD
jgi:hypothetical protein